MRGTMGGLALAGALVIVGGQPIAAQTRVPCGTAKAEGTWTVEGKSRAGIVRLTVASRCEALAGVPPGGAVPEMPSDAEVEVFGECPAKVCTWGKVKARTEGRDRIVLRVDQGFAVREVTLTLAGERLRARVFTDYVDARNDFGSTDTLKRVK